MSGTFLLGASHRNNQHCLGAVLANLRYRSWNVPTWAMDPHQSLMRTDPVPLPRGSPWALQYFSHTRRWAEVPEENASRARSGRSQVRDHSVRHFRPYAVLLVCWPSGLSVQRGPLRADCVRGGSIGIPHGAQVTKATRVGRPGTGSWKPGPEGRRESVSIMKSYPTIMSQSISAS